MRFFAPLSASFRTFGLSTSCSAASLLTLLKFKLAGLSPTAFASPGYLLPALVFQLRLIFSGFLQIRLYLAFNPSFRLNSALSLGCTSVLASLCFPVALPTPFFLIFSIPFGFSFVLPSGRLFDSVSLYLPVLCSVSVFASTVFNINVFNQPPN